MHLQTRTNRLPTKEIYFQLDKLLWNHAWQERTFYYQTDRKIKYPIKSFSSPFQGQALWMISGVHGDEPAGPNAIARNIDLIGGLGTKTPIVLIPLCNPLGYSKNWRYSYQPNWIHGKIHPDIQDADHLLPGTENSSIPRENHPTCKHAAALSKEILRLSQYYPPLLCLDFHEDPLAKKGYIYVYGTNNKLKQYFAKDIIRTLENKGVQIQKRGKTRFNEQIEQGIIWDCSDSSIDELLASENLLIKDNSQIGPSAQAVFVIETPARKIPLEKRIQTQSTIIQQLEWFAKEAGIIF